MHGGKLHDAKAARIEACRRGMAAIRRGAGATLGRHAGRFEVRDLPGHSARLLVCEPEAR